MYPPRDTPHLPPIHVPQQQQQQQQQNLQQQQHLGHRRGSSSFTDPHSHHSSPSLHDSSPASSSYTQHHPRSAGASVPYPPHQHAQQPPPHYHPSQQRPFQTVSAALAGSDIEYPGIMAPPQPHQDQYRRQLAPIPSNSYHSGSSSSGSGRGGLGGYPEPGSTPPHINHLVHASHTSPHAVRGSASSSSSAGGPPLPPPLLPPSHAVHPGDRGRPAVQEPDKAPHGYRPYLHDTPGERYHAPPWDQGYRELQRRSASPGGGGKAAHLAQGPSPNQTLAPGVPPLSAAVVAKSSSSTTDSPPATKRRRTKGGAAAAAAAGASDIPEGADVEYEDPSGDVSRGPVFVHPPKGAVQACIRCHRIKRKCDGAWPRCASCSRADVACVFELSAATSSYVSKLKTANGGLDAELAAAHDRIRELEMQLDMSSRSLVHPQPQHIHNSSSSSHHQQDEPRSHEHENVREVLGERETRKTSPPLSGGEFNKLAASALEIRGLSHLAQYYADKRRMSGPSPPPMAVTDIITKEQAHSAVMHYFSFNELAYPLFDKAEVFAEVRELYAGAGNDTNDADNAPGAAAHSVASDGSEDMSDRRKFLLFMVLAAGLQGMKRTGDKTLPPARALFSAAMPHRAKALGREDLVCVQALLILTLYATQEPTSGSMWQTLGLAGRVITAIGLHRRAEPHVSPEMAEKRRRVFVSFYNLDRLIAFTLSKPLTIAENDIDIELPTDQPGDAEYRGYPMLKATRYLAWYRRILGQTLVALYSVKGEQNSLSEPERRGIISDLHGELDKWTAAVPKPRKTATHLLTINIDKWLEINYYQVLCMLYRPSPLYPETTPTALRALHDASSRAVDLYVEMWRTMKVSFNLVQIIGLFVCSISFLCCLCECDTRMRAVEGTPHAKDTRDEIGLEAYIGADDPHWHAEIRNRVQQCRDLFDAFGRDIPLSAKYRDIFSRLSELLLSRHGPLDRASASSTTGSVASRPTSSNGGTAAAGGGGYDPAVSVLNATPALVTEPLREAQAMREDVAMDHVQPPGIVANPVPAMAHEDVQSQHQTQLQAQLAPQLQSQLQPQLQAPQPQPQQPQPYDNLCDAGVGDEIAGAWDAMTQLWYDLGDLFGDEGSAAAPFVPFDEGWAGEHTQVGEPVWWNQVT